tara:strand:- start:2370 stop:3071 length:702 start_codon:yes stop_codon:yes gene_type:complete
MKELILFLHVPKAAGTSINTLLKNHSNTCFVNNGNVAASVADVLRSNILEYEYTQALSGHFCYGIHKDINRQSTYTAILRNPVDRVLSLFFYALKTPFHYKHKELSEKVKTLGLSETLLDFIRTNKEANNNQVSQLSGIKVKKYSNKELDIATENIAKDFMSVGSFNYLNKYVEDLAHQMGWKKEIRVPNENANNTKPVDEIGQNVIDEIEELNQFDKKLFEGVKYGIFNRRK